MFEGFAKAEFNQRARQGQQPVDVIPHRRRSGNPELICGAVPDPHRDNLMTHLAATHTI